MGQKSTEDMRIYMRNYRAAKRQEAREALGGVCARCGTNVDLEFDHIDPSDKVTEIASMLTSAQEIFSDELDKCQLLCNPCHRLKSIENGDVAVAEHGSRGMYKNGCRCELCATTMREYNRNYYLTHK